MTRKPKPATTYVHRNALEHSDALDEAIRNSSDRMTCDGSIGNDNVSNVSTVLSFLVRYLRAAETGPGERCKDLKRLAGICGILQGAHR